MLESLRSKDDHTISVASCDPFDDEVVKDEPINMEDFNLAMTNYFGRDLYGMHQNSPPASTEAYKGIPTREKMSFTIEKLNKRLKALLEIRAQLP